MDYKLEFAKPSGHVLPCDIFFLTYHEVSDNHTIVLSGFFIFDSSTYCKYMYYTSYFSFGRMDF